MCKLTCKFIGAGVEVQTQTEHLTHSEHLKKKMNARNENRARSIIATQKQQSTAAKLEQDSSSRARQQPQQASTNACRTVQQQLHEPERGTSQFSQAAQQTGCQHAEGVTFSTGVHRVCRNRTSPMHNGVAASSPAAKLKPKAEKSAGVFCTSEKHARRDRMYTYRQAGSRIGILGRWSID